MGLFDILFKGKQDKAITGYFKTLTAYTPVFYTWNGKLYESELVRSAIDARARHISKLKVEPAGAANPKLQTRLKKSPNTFQTWLQFLYRLSTILDMQNNAFIVPVLDRGEITGMYPVLPSQCEIVEVGSIPYVRYQFSSGQVGAMELDKVGILTKFQYESDFFGSSNNALDSTMALLDFQKQGVKEAIRNGATYRFMAQANNFAKMQHIKAEREAFSAANFSSDEKTGGLLLFPNTYTNIQQLKPTSFTISAEEQKLIQTNVFNYYGVNEDILQNKAIGDTWSAFYEGCVEWFAIQFSEVATKMAFTDTEQGYGAAIHATANRLQYMSNKDKLEVSAQMADRGIMTRNEIREIWNLKPIPGGDVATIRGEYYTMDENGNLVKEGANIQEVNNA